MKVHELIAALQKVPPDADAVVWLPGSRIDLHGVIAGTIVKEKTEIWIEGNLRSGSALS